MYTVNSTWNDTKRILYLGNYIATSEFFKIQTIEIKISRLGPEKFYRYKRNIATCDIDTSAYCILAFLFVAVISLILEKCMFQPRNVYFVQFVPHFDITVCLCHKCIKSRTGVKWIEEVYPRWSVKTAIVLSCLYFLDLRDTCINIECTWHWLSVFLYFQPQCLL